MFDFGLYTQMSDAGPQGPLVLVYHILHRLYGILFHRILRIRPFFNVFTRNVVELIANELTHLIN